MTPTVWTAIFVLSLILLAVMALGIYILQQSTTIPPISSDVFMNFQAVGTSQATTDFVPTVVPGMELNVINLLPGSLVPIVAGGLIVYSVTLTQNKSGPVIHTIIVNNQPIASFQDEVMGGSRTVKYTVPYNQPIQTVSVYWSSPGSVSTVSGTTRTLTLFAWTG